MFIDFLFELRRRGVPVSIHEWLALMEALAKGLHGSSLDGFYHLCRAICVKDITHYDAFDEAFLAYFRDAYRDALEVTDELMSWLSDPRKLEGLSAEQREMLQEFDLEELRKLFEERLREQKERHDGGSRWVGTGGTSPFGNSGFHPGGIRVGGSGGSRSAMQVAGERRYSAYRKDRVLDVRQIDLALRRLRLLGREGADAELDLDETVDETCRNAGDLELVYRPPKRNRVKVVLLTDVGGSMTPHTELVERVFTAASRSGRFAKFRHFYFHNCVYEHVYRDALFRDPLSVEDLLHGSDRDEKLVVLGDALMHPAELLQMGGSVNYYHFNKVAGIEWLRRIEAYFRRSVWLNPEPRKYWPQTTIEVVADVFAMHPLTLEGIDDAVRYLVRGGARPEAPRGQASWF